MMQSPSVLTSKYSTSGKRATTLLGRDIWFFAVFSQARREPRKKKACGLTPWPFTKLTGRVRLNFLLEDAMSKNISRKGHPRRDLSTALCFGRDDKERGVTRAAFVCG